MIAVRLMGGLGNQMFQIAAARSLAERRHAAVAVDLAVLESPPPGGTRRPYALDGFASPPEILPASSRPKAASRDGVVRRARHALTGRSCHVYEEPHFRHDPRLLDQPDGTYLVGYWQSPLYFSHRRDAVRREFLPGPAVRVPEALAEEIAGVPSVAVHVRRGDYVDDPAIARVHGALDTAYYERALDRITGEVPGARPFVFSDDPAWCRASLRLPHATIVEGSSAGADLYLMSRCRHHVLANSTFGWWGAWLSDHPAKLVVAPRRWFVDPALTADDLIPAEWVRL